MTGIDKVRTIVCYQLAKLGWEYVYDYDQGIMTKNGLVFSISSPTRSAFQVHRTHFTNTAKIVATANHSIETKDNSWVLEKDGYLLLTDTFTKTYADSFPFIVDRHDETLANIPEIDFVKSVNEFSEMSDSELRSKKQYERIETKPTIKVLPVPSSLQFGETEFFMLNPDVDSSLYPEGLHAEKAYCYVGASERSGTVTVALANAGFTGASNRGKKTISISTFREAVLNKIIVSALPKEQMIEESFTVWAPRFSKDLQPLPEFLQTVNFLPAQLHAIETAFTNNLNCTYLLANDLVIDNVSSLIDLLQNNCDVSTVYNKRFQSGVLEFIASLRKQGIYTSRLELEQQPLNYIKTLYNNLQQTTTEFVSENYTFSDDSIRSFFSNVSLRTRDLSHLDPNVPLIVNQLSEFLTILNNDSLLTVFLTHGILREDRCTFSVSDLSESELAIVKRYFMTTYEIKFNFMDWSVFIDKVLNKSAEMIFMKNQILLRFSSAFLGHDTNSFYILDAVLNPVWRATIVNDKIIQNTKDEGFICTCYL